MKRKMRLALVVMKNTLGGLDFNLERHRFWIDRCLAKSPDFIGFPEFAVTGWVNRASQAISLNSAVVKEIEGWGKRYKVFIATCFVEKRGSRLYNCCLIVGPKGRVGVMRKVHLVSGECRYYTPGTEFPVVNVAGCKMGVTICADATRYEMMHILSLRGAEVIFAPHANILRKYGNCAAGWVQFRMERWPLFARDSGVYIAGVNNAGLFERRQAAEEETKYCGGAMVMDWTGNVVKKVAARTKKECLMVVDLDLAELRKVRRSHDLSRDFRPAIVYNRKSGWVLGRS